MESKRLPATVFVIQFLVLVSYSSLAVLNLLPLFFEHLGGTPGQIGFYVGVFSFAAFLSRPLGGWLLSRVHPRKVLLLGLVLMAGTTALYLVVRRLDASLVLLRILHGAGFSLFILAALLVVILAVREDQRTYAIGIVSTGFMLPLLVAPALGEEVIRRFGFPSFFLMALGLALVPLVFAVFSPTKAGGWEDEEASEIGFFRFLRQRRILVVFLLTFVFEIGLSASLSFVPLLAHQEGSMRAGAFYSALGMTAVLLRIFGGRWLKVWGDHRLLLPAFFFLGAGSVLTCVSRTSGVLALSGVVWGIGVGILYPHLTALSVHRVRARDKGKVLGLFASSVDLGFALGPLGFGWLSQAVGIRAAFWPLGLFLFFSSLILIPVGRGSFPDVSIERTG